MDRTPEEWRDSLLKTLGERRPQHARLRRYYDGVQGLPTAPQTASDTYRRLAQLGMTNMCGLVVDTVNERLRPKGVRLSENGDADLEVWRRVWQANNLDADWPVGQEEALKIGRGPVLVWPNDPTDKTAGVSVTVEDADEVIVAYKPGSRRERVAALKCYTDGEYSYAMVWTPGEVVAWWCEGEEAKDTSNWEWDPATSGTNPLGRVPVVEMLSKPSVRGVPAPELSRAVIALQDRINKTMFDTVVASEFGAFPQRYAIGIEVATDPLTGVAINPLTVGPNRTWILEQSKDVTASIGQLAPFPLADLLALADASIKHLASISQTPVYYLLSGLTNIGADSIRAAETGHVAKIIGHQTRFGEAAEEVFRLALIAEGNPDPPPDIEMVWAPPETRSPAELADAAIKLRTAGWPFEAVARYLGETPSMIARLVSERKAEQLSGEAGTLATRQTITSPAGPPAGPPVA